MDFLVAIVARALTIAPAATRSSMSAQARSGNVSLSSGGVCSPGDVGCPGDMDEVLFYTFKYIFNILALLLILRTLRFAAILLGGTATAVLLWVWERRLTFRPGQYFQSMVLR